MTPTRINPFEPAAIGSLRLPNRLLRSATFEGLCDRDGLPGTGYARFYGKLAQQGLGAMITGFAFVSAEGRAMQPGQAGISSAAHARAFKSATDTVHDRGGRIIVQLAHAGRQTAAAAVRGKVYAPSACPSRYFRSHPVAMTAPQISQAIADFAAAAGRARSAGFDGVQLHGAHGYLIHQFLDRKTNRRSDAFGIDPETGIGTEFLRQVISRTRGECGADFPLLIKIGPEARGGGGETGRFERLVGFLDRQPVDAIEVSCGTMENAFAIFRAASVPVDAVLAHNPRYGTRNPAKRLIFRWLGLPLMRLRFPAFVPMYNLEHAQRAKNLTSRPVICVGGFRSGRDIRHAIREAGIDFVSLSRPLICEPDFALKLRADPEYRSRCANCNECAVMCDSGRPTHCYRRGTREGQASEQ